MTDDLVTVREKLEPVVYAVVEAYRQYDTLDEALDSVLEQEKFKNVARYELIIMWTAIDAYADIANVRDE